MSIWTSSLGLITALALTGCVAPTIGGGGSTKAPARLSVLGGAVIVQGPRGYCIDRDASRGGETVAFVLLGSCAALSGSRFLPHPQSPAVLTASVLTGGGTPLAASFPAFDAFFRSEPGRGALSRSGDPANVEVLEAFAQDGAFYVHLRDTSETTDAGASVEPEYWRALMDLNGQIVTLSALGLMGRPLPSEVKRAVLDGFVKQMRSANPALPVAVAAPAEGEGQG